MADFSHLAKLNVDQESLAEYTFEDIPGEPSIWFRPMTDANPEYLNERVRLAVKRAETAEKETKAQRRARILSSDQLEDDREQDRILMARTCAVRWGKPFADVDGAVHDLDEQIAYDFFKALPNYMFDPCRGFVANVYNFIDPKARIALTETERDEMGNS